MQDLSRIRLPRATVSMNPSPHFSRYHPDISISPKPVDEINLRPRITIKGRPKDLPYLHRIKQHQKKLRSLFKGSGSIQHSSNIDYDLGKRVKFRGVRYRCFDFDSICSSISSHASHVSEMSDLELTNAPRLKKRVMRKRIPKQAVIPSNLLDSFDTSETSILWGGIPTGLSRNRFGRIEFA